MTEATERFFESLPARAPEVLRGPVTGALLLDLSTDNRTEHWLVTMGPGTARVTRENGPAEATWYSSAALFDRLVTGAAQGIAATLRNEASFSGNVLLYLAFRRFFPNPPGTRDPRDLAREHADRARADREHAGRERPDGRRARATGDPTGGA